MQNAEDLSPSQIGEFLKASEGIDFSGASRAEAYGWIQRTLIEQEYGRQRKKERGVIRAYLSKVTGRSLAQITRLIRLYLQLGRIETTPYQRHQFATKYTQADVALLADVDRAHERMNGPATLQVLKREYEQYRAKAKASWNLYAWRESRWRICTTCGAARSIANRRRYSSRRVRRRCRSASGGSRIREDDPVSCGWTRCTKASLRRFSAIGMEPKVYTTSMRWTP
jgi:hypothetical protein